MKLLAIDGNSLINRAFYGIKLLSTKDGTYTNAVYGFINILNKLLEKENPDKKFYTVREKQVCFDMKLVSLEKLYDILKYEKNEIKLDQEIINAATKPLERMLELTK